MAFLSMRAGFYERPYLDSAAESNGREPAGEVEDSIGLVALEHVKGADDLPRLDGGTVGLHDLFSVEVNRRRRSCWPKPVVRDQVG
jgi:hypothetical protein